MTMINGKLITHHITMEDWCDMNDTTISDLMCNEGPLDLMDSVVPALCDEGCEVEPDGTCEHGCPAITLALGII